MTTNTKYTLRKLGREHLMVLDAPDGSANMTLMLRFNEVAAMLWKKASEAPFTAETLTGTLREHFSGPEVTEEQMQHDVEEMLATWRKYNLVLE